MSDKSDILLSVRSLLQYHEKSGIQPYPLSTDLKKFLQMRPPVLIHETDVRSSQQVRQKKIIPVPPVSEISGNIEEIKEEIIPCRSCGLANERVTAVPGKGGNAVKLLIVGGWLTVEVSQRNEKYIFGREEDLMIGKMLQAIEIKQNEAFVTNVIKCGIPAVVQPKSEHINACISYLHRQISALSPQVICLMGSVAARTLLNEKRPLSQLRGRFHNYNLTGNRIIPVMPTYHPSFLLKNPEMKMATWNDLQLIQKKIK